MSPALADVLWRDAEIDDIAVGYDEVRISLLESTGRTRLIRCRGYIGYSVVGFWDEMIVERATLVDTDAFLEECLSGLEARHGTHIPDSGDPIRNRRTWKVLRIQLIDGAVLKVAAAEFASE